MDIEFDPAKDAANRVKHGLSLADAAAMDLSEAAVILNNRFDYGESRIARLGVSMAWDIASCSLIAPVRSA